MTDEKISTGQSKTKARTTGLLALAVISLLAGASVGASLEEFAAPEYAEDDWTAGVVDDATDDEDWDERESDDGPMKEGAKDFIRGLMSKRMDDRMDDRMEHLEQRVAAGQEFVIALEFCLEQADCDADAEALRDMIDNMESKHAEIQIKIEPQLQDEDRDDDEWYDCMTEEVWSEEKQAWCDAQSEGDMEICLWEDEDGVVHYECKDDQEDDEWYDCRTKELWSEEKQAWCDDFMDKENWHQWDENRKMDYSEDRARMLETASVAISYCLGNEACLADASAITAIHEEMAKKHDRHMMCAEDERCDRGMQDRRGLMQRFRDAVFGGPGEIQDREDRDTGARVMADLMIPWEICQQRGGEWVDRDGRSACVWPEYDRDCDKDGDTEDDGSNDGSEDDQDRDDNGSDNESGTQEECEASGGTWSEDRQMCY